MPPAESKKSTTPLVTPFAPAGPVTPVAPIAPVRPVAPVLPVRPVAPLTPGIPISVATCFIPTIMEGHAGRVGVEVSPIANKAA